MKTNNGGVTWTAITPSATNTGLGSFCAVPGRNAYMSVGLNSGSTAYVTSITPDDGTTWNLLESGTTNPFRMLQVQMLDSAHGWAGTFSNDSLPLGTNGMDKYKGPKIALACPLTVTSSLATLCSGDSSVLTASGLNTYTWTLSTGGTSSASTLTVTPPATASYTVAATTTAGCANTQTISITVNPTPTVSVVNAVGVSVGNDTLCTGGATYLTASGATTYSWSPSTGLNTHLGLHVTASPTTTTTYTLLGTLGACTSIITPTITVLSTPSPTLTVNSPTICTGATNSVTVNAGGFNTYTWSPVTGLSSTTGTSVVASPTVTTHYLVTGLDAAGTCETTTSFTVTVKAVPTINVTTSTATLCVNGTATLTASGASTYTWSTSQTGVSIAVTPTVTTSYTVVGTSTVTSCSNEHVYTQIVNSSCFAGIDQISANNTNISVYPNPNNGLVTISMSNVDEGTTMYVTNMIGQEVFKTSVKDVTTNLDLSSLQKGIYMLTITNGQNKHVEKLIIQ